MYVVHIPFQLGISKCWCRVKGEIAHDAPSDTHYTTHSKQANEQTNERTGITQTVCVAMCKYRSRLKPLDWSVVVSGRRRLNIEKEKKEWKVMQQERCIIRSRYISKRWDANDRTVCWIIRVLDSSEMRQQNLLRANLYHCECTFMHNKAVQSPQ